MNRACIFLLVKMLHCIYLFIAVLSWSNVSKQSSDIGDEVGINYIIGVDSAIEVE